jgi:hypothetical protein
MENDQQQKGNVPPATEAPQQYQPTQEEIERTRKVMRDSLSARKPKGFLASLKEWFS